MADFTDRLVERVLRKGSAKAAMEASRLSFIDTVSVIHAGWCEPVTRAVLQVYRDVRAPLAAGNAAPDPEHAALVWGTAAHALDYDDVHTTSVTHPSAVLIPALLAMQAAEDVDMGRMASAYDAGLAVNIALGEALGFGHYTKGWHSTSTIGPLAVVAALGHLLDLEESVLRSALSIAVSQAGGTQRNFGTRAKPVHAGLAAAAGIRAVRLARAGVDGSGDPFGERGFVELYRGATPGVPLDAIEFSGGPESLSRKKFPCCYLAHRAIAAALAVRDRVGTAALADEKVTVDVHLPYGQRKALRIFVPETGLEGKFSGNYTVAWGLLHGSVGLAAFEDEAVREPQVRELTRRVRVIEDELDGPVPVGIDAGTVRIAVRRGEEILAEEEIRHYPGSPAWPAEESEIEAKMNDCLMHDVRNGGTPPAAAEILRAADRFAGMDAMAVAS